MHMTNMYLNKARAHFWSGFRLFGILLFLVKLTPAMPHLVEFCWGKEGGVSYWISLARENHSSRNFGRFWVSSTLWSQWSRFQSHWRSFASDFASGKISRATRAISVLELFGGYVHPFLVIQKPMLAIFNLMNLMAEVSEPLEVIFTTKFSIQD